MLSGMAKLWTAAVLVALAACGADSSDDATPDAGAVEYTCQEYAAMTERVDSPRECAITGNDYVLTGVYYFDEELGMTWAQDVKSWDGEFGVYGQIDQWTPGCFWFPCEQTR